MKIGIPREKKVLENRVGLTPLNVKELINHGHQVFVESGAGEGSGFTDERYQECGAVIVETAREAWDVEMVVKVKEPQKDEFEYFYPGLILFAYLHLAPEMELTQQLLEQEVIAIGYETMEDQGSLPALTPMSEVAGRMSVQIAAHYLEKINGGRGVLLGGIPGVQSAKVTIIGGGVVGEHAAKLALGLGATVTILDINTPRLAELELNLGHGVHTLMSNEENIHSAVIDSDVVIGSVLIPGRRAPLLVKEETIKAMHPGSVLIDIAVDQGGNFETTTHATTHENPIYVKHGVIHYAVANIPGAVPRTATLGLTNVTLPFVKQIANQGVLEAIQSSPLIKTGVNTYQGQVTNLAVAESQNKDYHDILEILA